MTSQHPTRSSYPATSRQLAILWICVAGLFGTRPAMGQGLFEEAVQQADATPKKAESSGPLSGSLGGLGFELNGHLRGDLYLGKMQDRNRTETKTGYGEAGLQLRARKGRWGDAFGELRFRAGYENGATDHTFDVREGYVNAYLGPVDLRLGHQIIVWGRADGVNPTNNLTPRDMRVRSPDEDDQRLANLALRTHLNREPFRWELVWVPFFRPSYFPVSAGGTLPMTPPPGISLTMGEPDYPGPDITNSTLATRVHLIRASFEASASYLIGTSTFPGITLLAPPPDVEVAFASYRHQVVGADFATTVKSFGLRGEVAYRRPFDYESVPHVPRPDLQYVVGLDREFFGTLSIIAQYVGRVVFDWEEDPAQAFPPAANPAEQMALTMFVIPKNRMIAGQLEQVQHSATARVEWRLLQEALRLEVLGMFNFTTEEVMLRPKVSYDITDALKATIGAELYFGPEETLFGMIETIYSAGYAELRASF